ncbi:Fc receptor-like protein 5 [Sardina pilchardus]|uniref:Fc receptor-like protein 5 n=1 Tax=Sardina pilchardus TaxID=27697 RepID=UPI002E151AF8
MDSVDTEVLPKAEVSVISPQPPYYVRDIVTLRCHFQKYTDWFQYTWYNNGTAIPSESNQTITVTLPDNPAQHQYGCEGHRISSPQTSQRSDALSITSLDMPTPLVTVEPHGPVFIGETVILKCEMGHQNVWTYRWNIRPSGHYRYWAEYSDSFHDWYNYLSMSEFDENTLTIKEVAEFHQARYTCVGRRKTSSISSRSRVPFDLRLHSLRTLTATLFIQPQSVVLPGETVTLKCVIQSYSDWTFKWYKDWSPNLVFESEGNTFNINAAVESDGGQYWCQGERRDRPILSDKSRRVTLHVKSSEPKLTLSPDHQLLTGDSVTLRCELGVSSGLVFYWYRDTQTSDPVNQTDGDSYSISSVKVSDGGQYWCKAGRGDPFSTPYSNGVWVSVTDKPKISIIIKPNSTEFFLGENVSLRCEIQCGGDSNWDYSWYKNGLTSPLLSSVQEYTFAIESGTGETNYTCKGTHKNILFSTTESVSIKVVSGKADLKINRESWLTEGDSVTLSCAVIGSTTGWRFHWYKMIPHSDTVSSSMCKDLTRCEEVISESTRRAGGSYTLSPVALRHTGVYVCRAERGEPAIHTEFSSPQPLWVIGQSPPASLVISPNRNQHLSSESLTLTCTMQENSARWDVVKFRSERISTCPDMKESTCTLADLDTSDCGVYWCQDQLGSKSNPVNITVQDDDVILESPAHPVLEGDPLTLRCIHRQRPLHFRGDFYKDDSPLNQTSDGEMTIHSVSKEHEGSYWCQRSYQAKSPKTWITVRASSRMLAVGIGVGLGLVVILSTLFVLLCLSKKLKGVQCSRILLDGQQQSTNQSSTQDQIQSREGDQAEYMPLQRGTADVYDTIKVDHVTQQRGQNQMCDGEYEYE